MKREKRTTSRDDNLRRVAIVGGGPSGLFTSCLLQESCAEPPRVTLFEADARLGGKVLTARFASAPVPYEAGAAELYRYGETDPLWLFLHRTLGLRMKALLSGDHARRADTNGSIEHDMFGSTVVLGDRILRDERDVIRHLGKRAWKALRTFHARACEKRSPAELYDAGWPDDNRHPWAERSWASILDKVGDEDARHYLETLCHSDLATEPHLTNGVFGVDNYLMNDTRYCSLYWTEGGMERVIEALRERSRADIRLESPVTSIGRTPAGTFDVAWRRQGVLERGEFDAVIVALPNLALSRIDWQGSALREAMRAHVAHYDHPAHYVRISALFDEPFWREHVHESFFMHDALGGCCVYDESSRHDTGSYGVLGWLLGGNSALELCNLSDAELIRRAVDSLPESMGRGRDHLLEGGVHRWVGSASAQPGGRVIKGSKKRHRPEPRKHAGLFVVGDYLFDSTINGAFESAGIVHRLALEHLDIPQTTLDPDYFDLYDTKTSYRESFRVAFDASYLTRLIETVWGRSAPYRLLDVGSANGLTIPALAELGVEVWGIENNWYIHAQTPTELLERNLAGDVCELPFEDDFFDFSYDTCLAHVPRARLDSALRELHRVTKKGVFLGTVVKDFRPELVKKYDLFYGTNTLLTLEEWSELFRRHGFRPATTERTLSEAWDIERDSCDGETWYPGPESMRYCFYSKVNGQGSDFQGP